MNETSPYDEGIFNLVEMVNLNPNNRHVYTNKHIYICFCAEANQELRQSGSKAEMATPWVRRPVGCGSGLGTNDLCDASTPRPFRGPQFPPLKNGLVKGDHLETPFGL